MGSTPPPIPHKEDRANARGKPLKRVKTSEALRGNNNAEKWTEEEAINLYNEAFSLAERKIKFPVGLKTVEGWEFDFIGEIASELKLYHELLSVHLPSRFESCKSLWLSLKSKMESNCYSNTKKGIIKEATGIVNLKSNHGWTDRQQMTIPGGVTLHFDSDDANA